MVFVLTESTLGATGRDFTTIAAFDVARQANLTTGDGRMEIAKIFADADFTEVNTVLSGWTTGTTGEHIIISAAIGEDPIFKPAAASISQILTIQEDQVNIQGLTFDGVNLTGATNGLVRNLQIVSGRTQWLLCKFLNSPSFGFGAAANGALLIQFCLFANNTSDGIRTLGSGGTGGHNIVNCGFYNNGGWGDNGSTDNGNRTQRKNCWFFKNPSGSAQLVDSVGNNENFASWDDDGLHDGYLNARLTNEETGDVDALHFVDAPNGDFSLRAGSTMRKAGVPRFRIAIPPAVDLSGNPLNFRDADRLDIGPFQTSYAVAGDDTAPGKATSVTATPGDARAVLAFTTPADPTTGTLDRVGIAVSATSAADAATLANAGTFAKIIPNLAASTAFTGRDVAELSGGTDLANGVEHFVIVVPGTSKNVFNVSAVSGEAKSVTPVSGAATIIRQPVDLTVKVVNKVTLETKLVNP